MESPSLDQLRLLYIIDRYTGGNDPSSARGDKPNGQNKKTRWMKELHLSVIVYHAIQKGLFADYDWAPSLVEFHGVKMYGKVSQEANADLRRLQSGKLIDKLHLSTCLYETIRAYRSTAQASKALEALSEEGRAALEGLLVCELCSSLREVLAYVERDPTTVKNVTVHYCPRCCLVERTPKGTQVRGRRAAVKTVIDFFDLAEIVYRTRAASSATWAK